MSFYKRIKALSLAVAAASITSIAAAQQPPNVLFIAVDDLKPSIGAFGDSFARTPNLDQLAARGTIFLNAHCQQAVCAPSRVSLLTGLRPDTTKVFDLKTQFRPILPDAVTLPQRFRNAGYATIGMGKIYDPRSTDKDMDAASWSEPWPKVKSPADDHHGYLNPETIKTFAGPAPDPAPGPATTQAGVRVKRPPVDRADVPDNAYPDGAMTDVAIQRLDELRKSGKPFFLAVGYKKPHLPFNAPSKYWAMYDRDEVPLAWVTAAPKGAPAFATQPGWELRAAYTVPAEGALPVDLQRELVHGYYAATSYVDAQVGRLIQTLNEQGLAQNTIIVLWGDHGFHLGDHSMWCKHTNYEQATRAPLLFVAPGVGKPGTASAAPAEFVDIYPTLIDLAGLKPTGPLHGRSLKPVLLDPSASVKDLAISQYPRNVGKDIMMGYAYRDARYRLVQWRKVADGKPGQIVATELYDYQHDPLETTNLADVAQHAAARSAMEAKARAADYPASGSGGETSN